MSDDLPPGVRLDPRPGLHGGQYVILTCAICGREVRHPLPWYRARLSRGVAPRACPTCGAPWRRVVDRPHVGDNTAKRSDGFVQPKDRGTGICRPPQGATYEGKTIGWQPTCTCGGDPVPCVVLDPFGGSGTVAKVARDLGRSSISIELNPDYVEIAKRRLRAHEQLFGDVIEVVAV